MGRAVIGLMNPISRRHFVTAMFAAAASSSFVRADGQFAPSGGPLSKADRDLMTPARVIEELRRGNQRFLTGTTAAYDYRRQQRATAGGQNPAAIVLGCIDSRVPAEIIFDCGIGDVFNARIAGNVVNDDLLGSLEYACASAGARAILVLGHTSCGAIKAALDSVQQGHLTALLARIRPAIDATPFAGKHSSGNPAYADAVSRTHVRLGADAIRRGSPILARLEQRGDIQIAGAMYDVATGAAEFLDTKGIPLQQHIVPRHRHA